MNAIALFSGLGCGGAAVMLLRMAKYEFEVKKKTDRLTQTRIGDIVPGLCLTAGEVVCETPITTPYAKTPAVWYRYEAWERRQRKEGSRQPDQALASGTRCCQFSIKDENDQISIVPQGGTVIAYPHFKIMKSQSGKRTPLRDRIQKMKAADRQKYSDGQKKPFFRKIEMEDEPLDIPDDLIELSPESDEAKNAHRKYNEKWIQPGDYIYVLGAAAEGDGTSKTLRKIDKSSPLLVSAAVQDLTANAFQKNFIVLSVIGFGLVIVGVFLLLMGFGIL